MTIINEFQDLEKQLQDPKIISNPNLLREVSTRHAEIRPLAEKAIQIEKITEEEQDIRKLLEHEKDEEMVTLYDQELGKLAKQKHKIEKETKELSRSLDPNDKRDAIVEIRAGTGGEEAALFAADLFRMYSKFCENNHWQTTLLSANYTGNGGFKEVVIQVIGKGAYGKLKLESGVHRVQRIPETESSGRIHTSAASVVVLPVVDDMPDITIQDNEIKIDVYRSTGPGGQSVNTTDSAVRITHIPTGITVTCQDNKSQHKNKDKALSILKSKLYQIRQEEVASKASSTRKSAIQTGDRSAKIRTYNFPQGRITDHRIKKSWHNLTEALDGKIDEIIKETSERLGDEKET